MGLRPYFSVMAEWTRTSEDQWLHYWSRGLQLGVADPEGVITGVEEPTSWICDSMLWPDEDDEEVVEDEGYEADGEDEEDEEKEVEGPQDEGLGGEDSDDDDEDESDDEDDDEDGDEDGNDDEDGDELNVVNVVNGQEAVVMGGVVLAMGQAVVPPLPLPPVIHGDSDSGQGASTDASTDTVWSLVVGHDDSGADI